MKQFTAILLTFLYLTLTSGFKLYVHYCEGDVAKISFTEQAGDPCDMEHEHGEQEEDAHCSSESPSKKSCCKAPKTPEAPVKSGCCDDETFEVKLKTPHFTHFQEGLNVPFNFITPFESQLEIGVNTTFPTKQVATRGSPPPILFRNASYILNCSLVYYG